MPELPDIEYFKDYINHTAVGKKIVRVTCGDKDLLVDCNCPFLGRALHGKSISGARRRGKFLVLEISNSSYKIVIHFGVTGYLSYGKTDNRTKEVRRHGHLILLFANEYELRWVDMRKLGAVHFVRDLTAINLIDEMGPEPLEITKTEFLQLLRQHEHKNIKSFLMDQRDIAGIGSKYADEILFRAGISPHLSIEEISERRRSRVYTTLKDALTAAIAAQPPKNELPDGWLAAHHEDMQCPQNKKHELTKEEIAGRSTIWCPQHQN